MGAGLALLVPHGLDVLQGEQIHQRVHVANFDPRQQSVFGDGPLSEAVGIGKHADVGAAGSQPMWWGPLA